MTRPARLRTEDIHAIYRLIGECREQGDDPHTWRAHLLSGTAALAGATVVTEYEGVGEPEFVVEGIVDWGWQNGFDRRYWEGMNAEFTRQGIGFNPMYHPYMAALKRGAGPCLTRADIVPDADWYGSPYYQDYHRPSGGDAMMYSFKGLPGGSQLSGLILVRPHKEPDFTARSRALVHELHARVVPLIGGQLSGFADPPPSALPPRVRQVLRCLLEGDGDKQVAARLGISTYTVNEYTKRIYRHFGVQGRAELLARWVRRGWGATCAWDAPST